MARELLSITRTITGYPMSIESLLFSEPTLKVLKLDLDAQSKQLEAVSSNLANLDTPDYQAVEVDFESLYRAQLDASRPEKMAATNPLHFGAGSVNEPQIVVREEDGKSTRVDGNNVDLDKEMARMALAQLRYSAATTALAKKLTMISDALSGNF